MDAGYSTFLNLLQRPNDTLQSLPDATIYGAVAHYMTTLPPFHLPTFIRTILLSQTLWLTRRREHLNGCQIALRQAVRTKFATIKDISQGGFFSGPDLLGPMKEWMGYIFKGLSRAGNGLPSETHARLALLAGLLQGLNDIPDIKAPRLRSRVEEDVIIATNAALDLSAHNNPEWGSEFESAISRQEDPIITTLCLFSSVAYLIHDDRMYDVDLEDIVRHSLHQFDRCFSRGAFLQSLDAFKPGDVNQTGDAELGRSLRSISEDPIFINLGPISKLLAQSLVLIADASDGRARILAWKLIQDVVDTLRAVTLAADQSWSSSALSAITDEAQLATAVLPVTLELWKILKALLFSTVLISQSVISVIAFHRQPTESNIPHLTTSPPTAAASAAAVLLNLSHLAFVSSKFGGLTANGGGFTEQKRVFFAALDIVATDRLESEELIRTLSIFSESMLAGGHPARESHAAFFLACTEQLVPVISEEIIEAIVLPLTQPYLSNSAHRETYESAHSVMLAIFADNGKRLGPNSIPDDEDIRQRLALRLAPFYLTSLIENTAQGRLSTEQLRLAYNSLIRSTSTSSDSLSWFCIQSLLDILRSAKRSTGPLDATQAQVLRLRLALISIVSAVNLPLLPRILAKLREEIMEAYPDERAVLEKEVHEEIMKRVGDAQKVFAMDWWLGLRQDLIRSEAV